MATPKIIADFETSLATSVAVGDTSFTLSSATDDDGVSLPAGLYYFTIDNGSSIKEYIACTLSGTSCTSVLTVSRQGSETSGFARAHRVGASVIMTDFATYKKYMDAIALVSAPDASSSAKGVVEVATAAEITADTAAGSTSALLAITPDQLLLSKYGVFLSAMTGVLMPYAGSSAPTGFLLCDGSAVSRSTYATLFGIIGTTYGTGDGSTTFNVPDLRARAPIGAGAGTWTTTFSNSSDVNTGTDIITVPSNTSLYDGTPVVLTTSGSLPTGLSPSTTYYVIRVSATTIKLAASLADAIAGTPVPINITATGSGTATVTVTLTNRTAGQKGGEEQRSLSVAEMPAHSHAYQEVNGTSAGNGILTDTTAAATVSRSGVIDNAGGSTPHNIMNPFTVVNYIIKT